MFLGYILLLLFFLGICNVTPQIYKITFKRECDYQFRVRLSIYPYMEFIYCTPTFLFLFFCCCLRSWLLHRPVTGGGRWAKKVIVIEAGTTQWGVPFASDVLAWLARPPHFHHVVKNKGIKMRIIRPKTNSKQIRLLERKKERMGMWWLVPPTSHLCILKIIGNGNDVSRASND